MSTSFTKSSERQALTVKLESLAHLSLKILAAKQRQSMQALAENAILEYLERAQSASVGKHQKKGK